MSIEEYECDCAKCVSMCKDYPCRPLPEEVRAMPPEVRARLMITEDRGWFSFLQAAGIGFEGKEAPDFDAFCGHVGKPRVCTFLTTDGKCELHGKCKPWEGRVALHGSGGAKGVDVNERLEREWGSQLGQEVLREWRNLELNR